MSTGNQVINQPLSSNVNNTGGYVILNNNNNNHSITNSGGAVVIANGSSFGSGTITNSGGAVTIAQNANSGSSIINSCNITIGMDFTGSISITGGILSIGQTIELIGSSESNSTINLNGGSVVFLTPAESTNSVAFNFSGSSNGLFVDHATSQNYDQGPSFTGFNYTTDFIIVPPLPGGYNPYSATYSGNELTISTTNSTTTITYTFPNFTGTNIPSTASLLPISLSYSYVTPTNAVSQLSGSVTVPPSPTTQTYTNYYYYGSTAPMTPPCAVCIAKGTNILTPNGYVKIETLKKGSYIMVLDDNNDMIPKKIDWLGKFKRNLYDMFGFINIPVRFKKSSLFDNIPEEDLYVSYGHSIYIDGILVYANDLINGKTIVREYDANEIEYYHIKLDKHYIINANGALIESYFDVHDENRKIFENNSEIDDEPLEKQYPDMKPIDIIKKMTAKPLAVFYPQIVDQIKNKIIFRDEDHLI